MASGPSTISSRKGPEFYLSVVSSVRPIEKLVCSVPPPTVAFVLADSSEPLCPVAIPWVAPPPPCGPQLRLLGPSWARCYTGPETEEGKLAALQACNPSLANDIRLLLKGLRKDPKQDVDVGVNSTLRRREAGYLMWGAFELSLATTQGEVRRLVRELNAFNKEGKQAPNVPIIWYHPDGFRATIKAAKEMAGPKGYSVRYADKDGARYSQHYDCKATDLGLRKLPSQFRLTAGSGRVSPTFKLSQAEQVAGMLPAAARRWVKRHMGLEDLAPYDPVHWYRVASPTTNKLSPVPERDSRLSAFP